jgi:DNA mismatch endonuclease (patch repair protein)
MRMKKTPVSPRLGIHPPTAQRSAVMRSVPSSGTHPELLVRSAVRRFHLRPAYNSTHLPGKPDIVLSSKRKIIFVHGCFWHGHSCHRGARVPSSNRSYWVEKVRRNRRRHRVATGVLRKDGWQVLTVWECQTRHPVRLEKLITAFLRALVNKCVNGVRRRTAFGC